MVKNNMPAITFVLVILLVAIIASFISCGKQGQEISTTQLMMVSAPTVEWVKQYGDVSNDIPYAAAADPSGVYSAGNLYGTLPGQTQIGRYDAFVVKHNANGDMLWARQFGSTSTDYGRGVWADSSGVYVAGYTAGAFPGQTNLGSWDGFIIKYASNGTFQWTKQFGNDGYNTAFGVCADSSAVYVAGETSGSLHGQTSAGNKDIYLVKFDRNNGNRLWTRQIGSSTADYVRGAYADPSGIYVTGYTMGALPGQTSKGTDAYIIKYNASGERQWVKQFGTTSHDYGNAVFGNSSGIYVAGDTGGRFPGQRSYGYRDIFVSKFDPSNGNMFWVRQFGTSKSDYGEGVAADASGVYVGGHTYGTLPGGQSNQGACDAFARKYSDAGALIWTATFGTDKHDYARDLCANSSGVYVGGNSRGQFPGETHYGNYDGFLGKITAGPPPDTTPPALGLDPKSPTSRDWAPANIALTLLVSDDISGVKSAEYVWGTSKDTPASGWTSFQNGQTVTQKTDGIWYLHLRAEDKEGNKAATLFGSYKKDSLPPQISVLSPLNKATYLHNEVIPLSVTVIDALSGIKTLTVMLDGNDVSGQKSIGPLGAGAHILEVTAEDYAGNAVATKVTFNVILEASIDFDPDTLNLSSVGRWCTVYIAFPAPYSVLDIDNSSILLNGKLKVDPEAPSDAGMVKFSRAGVQNLLDEGEAVKITVTGQFDGKSFTGTDVIRVIDRGFLPIKPEKPEKPNKGGKKK